jgi:glycosyltransferase involved in cell wall biosynthesis
VKRAAANVALGETMRSRLIENKGAPPERTTIIADWADTTAVAPGPKRNPFSIEHGLADRFVVMHSGNIGSIVFVGEGVKKAALEAQVRELNLTNVTFLPFAPKERLGESFASADVFVVSLQRGLAGYIVPSKLYGILASGRPYIAAVEETCEVAALTAKHECGLVIEPGDAGALADAIRRLHGDRARAARLGAHARTAGLSFDRRAQVAKYAALFESVVAKPAAETANLARSSST